MRLHRASRLAASLLVGLVAPLLATPRVLAAEPSGLAVIPAGPVDDSGYPRVSVPLSVVDATTGRPVTDLSPDRVSVDDSAGPSSLNDLSPSTGNVPGAYVLVIDTSGSMGDTAANGETYMERAKKLARAFVAGLGTSDVVRLATFADRFESRTPWLAPTDGRIEEALNAIEAAPGKTSISNAILKSTAVAQKRPATFPRDAVVLLTDANAADKDKNLTLAKMKDGLRSPAFIIALRSTEANSPLDRLLTDVTTYSGGSFQATQTAADPDKLFESIRLSMRTVWTISFETDSTPDGNSHQASITIRDSAQQAGSAGVSYTAGGLTSLTQLALSGLRDGEEVSADRAVEVSTTGKHWSKSRIELFVDCMPTTCAPVATMDDRALEWRMVVAPMTQGRHTLTARVTVRDDRGQEYTTSSEIAFDRRGTSFNLELVALIGGLALFLIAATYTTARLRRRPARPHD